MQKIENTNFEFDLPEPMASRQHSSTEQSHNRKRRIDTTITTTTITVSKRSRNCTTQALDEGHIDYFRSMLDEPLSWIYNDVLDVEKKIQVNYLLYFFKFKKLSCIFLPDLSNPADLHLRAVYHNQREN